MEEPFLPFDGLSAWFSCCVDQKIVRQWDKYGGCYGNVDSADFLFSDNAFQEDTRNVYDKIPGISIFKTGWIVEIIASHASCYDVPVGKYFLPAHFITGLSSNFTTPDHRPPSLPPPLKTTRGRISLRAKRIVDGHTHQRVGDSIRHPNQRINNAAKKGKPPTSTNTVSVLNDMVSMADTVSSNRVDVNFSSDYIEGIPHIKDLSPVRESIIDFENCRGNILVTKNPITAM